MKHLVLVAFSLLALLASGSCAACNSDSLLPQRYAGQVLSTEGLCPTSQEQTEVEGQITGAIDGLIDSLLPQLQRSLSPSPCEGLGWIKIAHLDMTNSSHNCPLGWEIFNQYGINKRVCRRTSSGSCSSARFPTNGLEYRQVCGRIKAYQYGSTDAFEEYSIGQGLSDYFVDGIVVTRGDPPIEHVWTLAAGLAESAGEMNRLCPCVTGATAQVPDFVGQNYFCESGTETPDAGRTEFYGDDPLWDGEGCGSNSQCCAYNNPPYFSASLSNKTCDDLVVRICGNNMEEGVPVEVVELYVK